MGFLMMGRGVLVIGVLGRFFFGGGGSGRLDLNEFVLKLRVGKEGGMGRVFEK